MKALFIHIKRAFLEVYGFHGFDYTEHHATTATDNGPYEGEKLSFILVFFSFLGLPTRPSHLDRHDSPLDDQFSICRTEQKPIYSPKLSLLQVARNFIGGWVPIREHGEWVWTEKKRWQIVALPVKIGIILPLNIIGVPFQFALNLIKIITELSPSLIVDAAKMAYKELHKIAKIVYSYEKLGYLSIIPALLLGVAALAVKVIILALNVIKKLGIAFSSPEKSAKMAFVYGRKFILRSRNKESVDDFAFAMGVFLAFVSILTSAILWSIFLPVALGAIGSYIPAVLQVVNTVLHLPLISSCYALVHAGLLHLGTLLSTASTLGGTIMTLAGWIGVQFSIEFMLVCSTFALLMTPICAILARVVDDLSNRWHQWDSKTGILSSFFAIFSSKGQRIDINLKPLLQKISIQPLKTHAKTTVSEESLNRVDSLKLVVQTAEDLERLNTARADSAAIETSLSFADRPPISTDLIQSQHQLGPQNNH
jgi:uncharacterized protein (DUF2062 family)